MSMAISRVQELQECFPQLGRGTVESILHQVGSERAVDVLLEMTSDSGEGASHKVDIHPSQLMGALLPTEDSRPFTASLDTVAQGGNGKSDSSYLNFKPSPRPPSPVPLRRLTPSQPPLLAAYPKSLRQKQPAVGQHAWSPAWQGGRPVAQPSPPQLPPTDASADDTPLEELLQTLNSGSDDSCSDSEAAVYLGHQVGKEVAMHQLPKLRPYNPAAVGSAAASPRLRSGLSSAEASADAEESDDVSMEQLLLDMIGGDSPHGKGNGQTQAQVLDSNITGLADQQEGNGVCSWDDSPVLSSIAAPAPVRGHNGFAADSPALQHVELLQLAPQPVAYAEPVVGAASPNDLIAGCIGDGVITSNSFGSSGDPWPEACASPGKRRAPSAAESMYSLSGSSSGKRGCDTLKAERGRARSRSHQGSSCNGASREPSVTKSETSSQSSSGAWDNTEDALSFLTTCFPGNPLVSDILAGCNGDANAATAKLLELKDEEQAHALAQAMQEAQELSVAPAKVDMDEGQKLAILTREFPELSADECSAALEAQAGNLQAAVAILDMHVSSANTEIKLADFEVAKQVAAEEQRAHEQAVADQQAADFAMAMGLQDVAEKAAKPSPAASPEDLAAIAALEAGNDIVLQLPRTPTPASYATNHQAASPYLVTGRALPPPPPPSRMPLATYTPHHGGQSAQDCLWKELRGPAEAVREERRKAMDAAATAYRKGRTAQAKELLGRAAALQELATQKEDEASKAMFRAKNLDLKMPTEKIDLHGQKVAEARDMLIDLLGPYIKYKHKPVVEIITGRGLHSEGGEARIRPMVKQYLQEQGLHFVERPGSFQVHFQE